jgi:hypothetical protein
MGKSILLFYEGSIAFISLFILSTKKHGTVLADD